MAEALRARDLRVFGIVQGVGFRPFVYRLARRLGLHGWVRNTAGDVTIHLEGDEAALDRFQSDLLTEAPPLARIERVLAEAGVVSGATEFSIESSGEAGDRLQPVPPDVATCADCLQEMRDPSDRRFGYPFTNCTNCGPRYTIIEGLPYDRPRTTMRAFPMCDACRAEYEDPENRRFHAQPVACPVCGPHVWLEIGAETVRGEDADIIAQAAGLLAAGKVVAIKGLGGFHLAADATDDAVLATLRQRKHRPDKAFAVMVADLETARRYCVVAPVAAEALSGTARPVVLLPVRPDAEAHLSGLIAPDHDTVGVMLPYTPLHHLLLAAAGRPLVLTSGNLSEEPLAIDNDEARSHLGSIADAFLMHDRPIHTPCDDSVVAVQPEPGGERLTVVRRARGYAPSPVHLPVAGPQVLAVGPELKSTACVARDDQAFLSQHIGDLVNLDTWEHYRRIVDDLERLFHVSPECIARDAHPDYMSTAYALERGESLGVPVLAVQHHHAHALSCLTDAGIDPGDGAVQAVVLDGTGYGDDGLVWGGEWLMLEGASYRRFAHLQYLSLAGGEAAIRHVDRLAAGYLLALGESEAAARLPALAHLAAGDFALLRASLRSAATVQTSSMGRLFDAVAGLLGISGEVTYEAQAAIRLETAARQGAIEEARSATAESRGATAEAGCGWPVAADGAIGVGGLLREVVAAVRRGDDTGLVASRFHRAVAEMVGDVCLRQAEASGARTVALSGGCFQNTLLTELCVAELRRHELQPITHGMVPCNDGGVALGQAAAARLVLAQGRP
ncbi:MAG: carbamoyltransferase HypF [Anaerolineae bacterium]